jgi:hypothetical protein
MPMDFPDMASLIRHAELITPSFRKPLEGESEEHYRAALADHVEPLDFVESQEIRNKVGWDKFSKDQGERMVLDAIVNSFLKRRTL